MKQQQGFTLIELIVVIVILGILAATALPKFVDLSKDAKQAALKGMAGAIASGGSINYAAKAVSSVQGWVATSGATCTAAAASLVDASTSLTGYSITGNVPNCTINVSPTDANVTAQTFTIPAVN